MNKIFLTVLFANIIISNNVYSNHQIDHSLNELVHKKWISGSQNCEMNHDPVIETYRYNKNSYILRQNKCIHYEAPFIYVLLGKKSVFILDTGATADEKKFPLQKTIQKIINDRYQNTETPSIIVAHSHSHGDHIAADAQFKQNTNTTVIEPQLDAIKKFFGLQNWPQENATLDLGDRTITIIPIPGHQAESIAIYDEQTHWLLTGDTFYPGRLYIKDWQTFKNSIKKLVSFSTTYKPSAILGTHIEMTNTDFLDYPIGSTYQPNEASLVLALSDLLELNNSLSAIGDEPRKNAHARFIIYPVD